MFKIFTRKNKDNDQRSKDDLFVEIEGRKVPTPKQLRKMGLMRRDGTIPTIITKVSDSDYALTPEQVRTIVWNLMKYSSITFLERLIVFFKTIERGYEKAISDFANANELDIENLKYFNEAIHIGEISKKLILSDKKAAGYKHLRGIMHYKENFKGRKADELSWEWLGESRECGQKSRGLYLWIENAIRIGMFVTKGGRWIWPSDITEKRIRYNPPDFFEYPKTNNKLCLKTGDIIPVTGIWNPCDFKSGCPSYLLAGEEFPNTEIAIEKLERPEFFDEDSGELYKGWIDYEYQEHPSRWELLWEDNRYLDGTIPEEEKEYLDESCSFPDEPPEAVKVSP